MYHEFVKYEKKYKPVTFSNITNVLKTSLSVCWSKNIMNKIYHLKQMFVFSLCFVLKKNVV